MADFQAPNSAVLFERVDEHVALVTLNRPEKRNAVNGDIATGMDACVRHIEESPDLWVAVLASSNDKVFCAGADLAAISEGRGLELETEAGGFAGFVYYPRTKPWIAAPRGSALGGGLELCLACDLIVAADDCRFGLPEVKRSLLAGAGGLSRLPNAIPLAIATEMVITGEPITAEPSNAIRNVRIVVPFSRTGISAQVSKKLRPQSQLISDRDHDGVGVGADSGGRLARGDAPIGRNCLSNAVTGTGDRIGADGLAPIQCARCVPEYLIGQGVGATCHLAVGNSGAGAGADAQPDIIRGRICAADRDRAGHVEIGVENRVISAESQSAGIDLTGRGDGPRYREIAGRGRGAGLERRQRQDRDRRNGE